MPEVMFETQECPMCASSRPRVLNERSFQGRKWSLVRCRTCGLHFTVPLPTAGEIRRFYEGEYHAGLLTEGRTEAVFADKYRRYVETLARHLGSGHVVDVGCATGLLVRM